MGAIATEAVRVITGEFDESAGARTPPRQALFCRVVDRILAVPLDAVVEIMRPLPIRAFSGTPEFVLGVATIRGAVVPVVDVGVLLAAAAGRTPTRYVTVRQDGRVVALSVDAVIGLQPFDDDVLHDLPPLLNSVQLKTVTAIGGLDAGLLLLLDHTHLVPHSVWTTSVEQVTTS